MTSAKPKLEVVGRSIIVDTIKDAGSFFDNIHGITEDARELFEESIVKLMYYDDMRKKK